MRAVAKARANIALVKYWGKRNAALNTPARGSLSVTLDALVTETSVELVEGDRDELVFDGAPGSGSDLDRVSRFLDLIRERAKNSKRARIVTSSTFPSASGLASSASGFAALAVASLRAYGLSLTPREVSILARRGSGSAARSIFGGFVRMHAGERNDGTDAFAEPIEGTHLELHAAIAVFRSDRKKVASGVAMEWTRERSPYYEAWLATVERDLAEAEDALKRSDFSKLGEVAEGNCLAMHACVMAARPGIFYFCPSTLWAIDRIRSLRTVGVPVFFTIDAGPHLVAFTTRASLRQVAAALEEHPDIDRVIRSEIGGPAELVDGGHEGRGA